VAGATGSTESLLDLFRLFVGGTCHLSKFKEPFMPQVSFTLNIRYETEKAICVSTDGSNSIWLPKSQIEFAEIGQGQVEVTMPDWLAEQKDLT
jgi:hypothetical protein